MAKKPDPLPTARGHHGHAMGHAAHAAMKHLGSSGGQTVNADPASFTNLAELQEEGPAPASPRPYDGMKAGR